MLHVTMIGCGAIGSAVLEAMHGDSHVAIDRVG